MLGEERKTKMKGGCMQDCSKNNLDTLKRYTRLSTASCDEVTRQDFQIKCINFKKNLNS